MENNSTEMRKKAGVKKVLIILLAVFLLLAAAFLAYCLPYYHADPDAGQGSGDAAYVEKGTADGSGGEVKISDADDWIFYDGPGKRQAMVFYPGAKVDENAYGPLMYRLAEDGTDCFLVRMPLHLAIFGKSRAGEIIEEYKYEKWIMAGHSLGGSMAASFAASDQEQISGIVFLASYPAADLSKSPMRALSIYGSCDGVLNRENYADAGKKMPRDFTEHVIEGGNHAGFAYYGPQRGDSKASISKEEQISETADIIEDWLED